MIKTKVYLKILDILQYIELAIKKYKKTLLLKVNINNEKSLYSDLMPKDQVSRVETYHEALDWAIDTNKKIKNIALSGPYGAGKSTIIESYIKRNNIKENKYLKISLATFDEKDDKEDKQQIIEKSILEQIIYRIDGKKTPFSRFKKINKIYTKNIWKTLIILITFFVSGWSLYNINHIFKFQRINFSLSLIFKLIKENWLVCIISIFFVITLFIILYYFIYIILKSVKISKIKFDKTEIEVISDDNESIYNKYLDELLYFFQETEYEILIFEDIDRFENPYIFTNLREINNFLNNYENINRRIIFLYAIKDNMFLSKERTKFFDFIIPVIPFVDAFNSRQIVLDKFNDISNKPSERLIKDITIFLDDMRMLNNIINEYIIYYNQINNDKINCDKLFSIIVYKNLMPNDFFELQYNKGFIKKIFDSKSKFIKKEIENINIEIKNMRHLIGLSDSIIAKSIEDLEAIFVNRWRKKGINFFKTNDNSNIQINVQHNINIGLLGRQQQFVKNKSIQVYFNGRYDSVSYDDLFTAFKEHDDFFIMAEAIKLKNKENLEKEKEKLNVYLNKNVELELISLKNLIKEYNVNEIFDDIQDEKLIIFLIKNGYIDENYRHYISYFYPGAISEEDMEFLRNVKNSTELGYDYTIKKVNEIIDDISTEELKSKSVLNNSLLEYLLNNLSIKRERFNIILDELIKNINERIDFIDQFFDKLDYTEKEIFIIEMCKRYTGFWNFIINESKFTKKKIDDYFACIIDSCNIDNIIKLNTKGNIKKFIQNTKHTFQIDYKSNVEEKLKSIFKELDIKFYMLESPKIKNSSNYNEKLEYKLISYVLENNMFEINEDMIRYFYKYIVDSNNEKMKIFDSKNYSSIKNLENKYLYDYIESDLNKYLTEVFLKLPENTDEDVSIINEFLNNNSIDINTKSGIISKCKFIIEDFKTVPSILWSEIIQCEKWNINWHNIICIFEEYDELSEEMLKQINKGQSYIKLSSTKIDDKKDFSDEVYNKLYQYLYENEILNNDCFSEIINSIPNNYICPESKKLVSNERLRLILDKNHMDFLPADFLYLKANYISLFYYWSIKNFDGFLKTIIKNIQLDIEDIELYLRTDKITKENKIELINLCKDPILNSIENIELVELISKINKLDTSNQLDSSILEAVVDKSKDE